MQVMSGWMKPVGEKTLMKLAVVGAGYWGANLVRVFHELAVLDGICESNTQKAQELAALYPNLDKRIDLVEGQFVVESSVPRSVEFPPDEPLVMECRHFLECMESRRTPKTDGHD